MSTESIAPPVQSAYLESRILAFINSRDATSAEIAAEFGIAEGEAESICQSLFKAGKVGGDVFKVK